MSGPVASRFDGDAKALRKTARRAAALHGAEGAVVVLVHEGQSYLASTHSIDFIGAVLEKALNDWRAAKIEQERAPAGAPATAPVVVEAKHIPKLAALTALTGGRGRK